MRPQNYPTVPKDLWEHFYQLTQIPRASKKEQRVREYLKRVAETHRFSYLEDKVGNVILNVAARGKGVNGPVLAIQNHLDMVCDKIPTSQHDFDRDPLKLKVDEDWLLAQGTTLGADNGIGVAAALALATAPNVDHPPLELVFTVDEETGLGGALNLQANLIKAKRMLNLDTEEWGAFYVGCAGGRDWEFSASFNRAPAPTGLDALIDVGIGQLTGGHSGIDIHRQRGNAIVLLAQCLAQAQSSGLQFCLSEIHGGQAHNVIPRQATATLAIQAHQFSQWETFLQQVSKNNQTYLPAEDRSIKWSLIKQERSVNQVLTVPETTRFISFLLNLPHGAHSFVLDSPDPLVSLSSNVAIVHLNADGKFYGNVSLRFSVAEEIAGLEQKISNLCWGFGIEGKKISGYPNWQPRFDYPLLHEAKALYKELYGHEVKIRAIHAGLECGIIKDQLGDIQVLSLGPTILGAHSPTERVNISSVSHFWDFLKIFVSHLGAHL